MSTWKDLDLEDINMIKSSLNNIVSKDDDDNNDDEYDKRVEGSFNDD